MFPDDRPTTKNPVTSVTDLSPIGFWRFENNLNDTATVGPYNLSLTAGSETYGAETDRGIIFGVFDASTYYSASGYKGILGSNPRAISCWVKIDGPKAITICTWGTPTIGERWTFRTQTSGELRTECAGANVVGTKIITDGKWHHVVSSLEAGDTDMNQVIHYVDGEVDPASSSSSQALNTTSAADVTVGAREAGTLIFDGDIDELAIFNGLTPANVASLYENGLQAYDETKVWDEETKTWYAETTNTGKQRLAQAGGRLKTSIIAVSDQARIYVGTL